MINKESHGQQIREASHISDLNIANLARVPVTEAVQPEITEHGHKIRCDFVCAPNGPNM